jgi:hypothetical protein
MELDDSVVRIRAPFCFSSQDSLSWLVCYIKPDETGHVEIISNLSSLQQFVLPRCDFIVCFFSNCVSLVPFKLFAHYTYISFNTIITNYHIPGPSRLSNISTIAIRRFSFFKYVDHHHHHIRQHVYPINRGLCRLRLLLSCAQRGPLCGLGPSRR